MKFSLISWKFLDSRKFYRVALKTRSNRAHLKTLTPKGGRTLAYMRMTSMILKRTTRLSKRLNNDTKYPCSPKLYIFSNISRVKRMTKNKLAIAEKEKCCLKRMILKLCNNKLTKLILKAFSTDELRFDNFVLKLV